MGMQTYEVRAALRNRYNDSRRYAIAEEVGLTTGFSHRRLDMIVLDCYYSNGFRIDGFEIKVSTSDLRRELEDPEKHIAFFDVIDYYTIAAPKGVVDPVMDIIPKKWGVLIINEDGTTRFKRKPLALEDRKADKDVPRGFLASITRNIQGHQPSAMELEKEYKRGIEEGKDAAERNYNYREQRLKSEFAKIEAYDKLTSRLRIWSSDSDSIEEILDEFENFRKLNVDWVKQSINTTINQLELLTKKLNGEAVK